MAYSEKVIDHYENPRNVGVLDKDSKTVGTGMVGAPACGDVMKLQIEVGSDGHGYGSSFSLYSDGDYQEGDYGISEDGRVLIHSYGEEITITDALENDCYKISVYDVNYKDTTNGTMCREGNIL